VAREKALQVSSLLYKIETYEALIDEITGLETLDEIAQSYGENIDEELIAVVQLKLDKLLKELEEM
jgi:hypothetical protein